MPEYVRVASKKEIPSGQGRVFAVGDRQVAVFNVGGKLHAIDNRCEHQQGPLADGDLDGRVVTCPWHGWTYDVTSGQSPDDPATRVPRDEAGQVPRPAGRLDRPPCRHDIPVELVTPRAGLGQQQGRDLGRRAGAPILAAPHDQRSAAGGFPPRSCATISSSLAWPAATAARLASRIWS